jgi:tRNA threonylcarbamoyladenosine biosynthesis protein TsaB
MKLLAIDSATERLAIAAVDTQATGAAAPPDGRAIELDGGMEASRRALPALLALLEGLGWRRDELGAIAFGQGPGGFTGLRTACAVAQGLACGLGLPVLAIDSLCLVAEAARVRHPQAAAAGMVWVAMDARMDEIYAAAYRWHDDAGWQTVQAPCLVEPAALARAWAGEAPSLVAGSALAAFGDRLPAGPWVAEPQDIGRADALARLSAAAWQRGEARPAAQALPLYLRDKVALTTTEREARKAALSAAAAAGEAAR